MSCVLICYRGIGNTGSCPPLIGSALRSSLLPVKSKTAGFTSASAPVSTWFLRVSCSVVTSYLFPSVSCALKRNWILFPVAPLNSDGFSKKIHPCAGTLEATGFPFNSCSIPFLLKSSNAAFLKSPYIQYTRCPNIGTCFNFFHCDVFSRASTEILSSVTGTCLVLVMEMINAIGSGTSVSPANLLVYRTKKRAPRSLGTIAVLTLKRIDALSIGCSFARINPNPTIQINSVRTAQALITVVLNALIPMLSQITAVVSPRAATERF